MPSLATILACLSLGVWIVLTFFRGAFWQLTLFDDDLAEHPLLETWPRILAVLPARNEQETIARSVRSLVSQDYPGEFRLLVVDDHSDDETASLARSAAETHGASRPLTILPAAALPPGWTGKLWALEQGVEQAASFSPAYFWFTDADIVHAPDTLRRLVSRAEHQQLDLASFMVLLEAKTFPERLLIPPFLYFFLKLYPPRWIADRQARTAGAAGGAILLRRKALDRIGGFATIRKEVIDDCRLARAVKRSGGAIWMGLTRKSVSLRTYKSFAEIRDLIARTAFTELEYSPFLLLGTLAGLFLAYLAPVILAFDAQPLAGGFGLAAWALMTITFLPTVRFYRISPFWAPLLPLAAAFYSYSTLLSAVRFWLGRGGQWKGRAQAPAKP